MLRVLLLSLSIVCGTAQASLMMSSPTGAGPLDNAIPDFGGAVIDIVWDTGDRFNAFLGADALMKRETVTTDSETGLASEEIGSYLFNPELFSSSLIGGIAKLAIRLSLYDGDNATMEGVDSIEGQFQANENFLGVNGANLGNFSTVETVTFTQKGEEIVDTPEGMTGFLGGHTGVGWFFTEDSSLLETVFKGIEETGSLQMTFDVDKVTHDKVKNLEQKNYVSFGEPNKRPVIEPKPDIPTKVNAPAALILMLLIAMGWIVKTRKSVA
ncbi:hypothetical protein DRW07_06250 [Alteromonas sediminis]|uniref:PEP-CTERM sorting domain-containing protein n=1 Tax=Alteromonas sediminis TaxID=2259342 RepID=A0A3N5ZBR7_9ALTE|nr:hypothetical protein [Alteromonas sediminis]RPJ67138.1 hypothetical protein DRW07_06250 [Alteromonas sediminis]